MAKKMFLFNWNIKNIQLIKDKKGVNLINISLKSFRTYYALLLFTGKEEIDISYNNKKHHINNNNIAFIKKNVNLDIKIKGNTLPKVIKITNNLVTKITKYIIFIEKLETELIDYSNDALLVRDMSSLDKNIMSYLFDNISNENADDHFYEIMSLLKRFNKKIYNMIIKSSKPTIADEIISLVSTDISKKWSLNDLSNSLFLSNISIRKKLELEGITFTEMILDLRMRHALSLIVSSRKNLYSISEEIGYNSTSYFIKNFKDYYGVTPKKLGLMLNNVNRIIL